MTAVVCGIVAKRGKPYWELAPGEVAELAKALDPPLARIPLPEKELGVVAELGALGFVCFAIFAPRMDLDKQIARQQIARKRDAGAVVAEAEEIARRHAAAPYGGEVPDFGTGRTENETAGELLVEPAGATVAETEPDLVMETDRTAREVGITAETVVGLRKGMGVEGDLLEHSGVPFLDDGSELDRGLPEPVAGA